MGEKGEEEPKTDDEVVQPVKSHLLLRGRPLPSRPADKEEPSSAGLSHAVIEESAEKDAGSKRFAFKDSCVTFC